MGWCNGGNHGDAVHVETASLDRNCRCACAEIYKVKKKFFVAFDTPKSTSLLRMYLFSRNKINEKNRQGRCTIGFRLSIYFHSFLRSSLSFSFFFFGVRMEIDLSTEIEIPSIMSFVKAHCTDSGSQNLYGWK